MKFKKFSNYYSKNNDIHLSLGLHNRRELSLDARLLYISAHNSISLRVYYISWKFRDIYRLLEKWQGVYMLKIAIAVGQGGTKLASCK